MSVETKPSKTDSFKFCYRFVNHRLFISCACIHEPTPETLVHTFMHLRLKRFVDDLKRQSRKGRCFAEKRISFAKNAELRYFSSETTLRSQYRF